MITVSEADRLLRDTIRVRASIEVPLVEAGSRTLREDVSADRDYPPFNRVAMDGVAVASTAILAGAREFTVAGLQKAGEPPRHLADSRACLEIMTGASLPSGADTIVRYEDLVIEAGRARLAEGITVTPGQNVHARASDRKQGDPVLHAGVTLFAPQIAVLASLGKTTVRVAPTWNISILTTGDELVDLGAPVLPHQIRRSNAYAIRAACAARGDTVRLLHAGDNDAELAAKIEQALHGTDLLLLSGGVSMGKFDLVPSVLARLGVRNIFHKVAQKPGKPLWFGITADDRPVFGLPGNPVSALVCLYRYVLPYLDGCARSVRDREEVWLPALPKAKHGLTFFAPVRRHGFEAVVVKDNGSGDFASLGESDGFVQIDGAARPFGGGFAVPFFSWSLP